jgi:hypothetical protein
MINDPHELALLPEREQAQELFEEPRPYKDFFYDDHAPASGRETGHVRGIHTQVCRFNQQGEHAYVADDCPHGSMEDEQGRIMPPGWTVQQG